MVKEVQYHLIRKMDRVEIRLYEKLIIAEVAGYGENGFNLLFDYISGNNTTKTNLEMTAPVLSEDDSITFVMPEIYTLDNTPQPNDERIKIKQIPKRYVAILKFSGRWTNSNFIVKSKQLLEELEKSHIKTKGNVFTMRYSGPLTPWFLRRNEVAI